MIYQPKTLGEHLRNRRLAMGMRQEDVARQLGTLREVYERWERDERQPVISEWPGILSFLGYYPFGQETTADLVMKARRCQVDRGLSLVNWLSLLGGVVTPVKVKHSLRVVYGVQLRVLVRAHGNCAARQSCA